jgi:transaldolase
LEVDVEQASRVLSKLSELGIDLKSITDQLEKDGVEQFIQAFDKLMQGLKNKSLN